MTYQQWPPPASSGWATPPPVVPVKPWRGLASASLACGIIGLFGVLSLAGVVLGSVALWRAGLARQRPTLAAWGVAVSTVTLAGGCLLLGQGL